jgi:Uma2 family endonuclease
MPTLAQPNTARKTRLTMYDLPSEEVGDAGMPDEYHAHQAVLLNETFKPVGIPADQVFSAVDMNLYYDEDHHLRYKRPDWFGVIGVTRLYQRFDLRWSYVVWDEQVVPLIVVELLSDGTEDEDLGYTLRDVNRPPTKWQVYERILQIPYYVVFSRKSQEMRIFQSKGHGFVEATNHGGRFWIQEANLGLGIWQGNYHDIPHLWLRWFDADGNWIPTDAERAQEAGLRAEQESQRAERLAERLRQLGHNPDQV